MRCKKCGKRIKEKEMFCTYCGYYNGSSSEINKEEEDYNLLDDDFDNNNDDDELFSELNLDNKDSHLSLEERYLEAFIGEDYKLIKEGHFNIFAALFNWVYLLYRKLFISGILGLTLSGIIIIFLPKVSIIYFILTIIIFALFFNKIYLLLAKKKIQMIESRYEGSDIDTMEEIMSEKGGVNFTPAIIIYFIFLLVVIFNILRVNINSNHNTKYWKENSENKANCNSLIKKAYKELKNSDSSIMISEAACQVIKTNPADYEIYLKDLSTQSVIYYYYQISNGYITIQNNTKVLKELEIKSANNTITEEEKISLDTKRNVVENYKKIYNQAKKEDELIKQKKNTKEKKNYIFSQIEVNQ